MSVKWSEPLTGSHSINTRLFQHLWHHIVWTLVIVRGKESAQGFVNKSLCACLAPALLWLLGQYFTLLSIFPLKVAWKCWKELSNMCHSFSNSSSVYWAPTTWEPYARSSVAWWSLCPQSLIPIPPSGPKKLWPQVITSSTLNLFLCAMNSQSPHLCKHFVQVILEEPQK